MQIIDPGLIDFLHAWELQKKTHTAVLRGDIPGAVIVCQHTPVFTLGRQGGVENILVSPQDLIDRRIPVYEIERGGDVTYHGPGQIIIYPVIDLSDFRRDIHWYLRELESIGIDFLSDFGIAAARRSGATGVWVGDRKIASIGITIKRWVTYHGIAVNIKSNDMANFRLIRPCGMDIGMTCLETELGRAVSIEETKQNLIEKCKDFFYRSHVVRKE